MTEPMGSALQPDGPDSVFCPIDDREFKQADYGNRAMAYLVDTHMPLQHPEYTNLKKDDSE